MGEGVKKDLGQPKAECDPTVTYKNSSGFLCTNFSVKYRPYLNLLTVVLAIKPLFFIYVVGKRFYSEKGRKSFSSKICIIPRNK
jgi:hypothetical protein